MKGKKMTETRNVEVVQLLMHLADVLYDLAKEANCDFKVEATIAPEIYGYPPGTAQATAYMGGYMYVRYYNGEESIRYKQVNVIPEQIRIGKEPAGNGDAIRTGRMMAAGYKKMSAAKKASARAARGNKTDNFIVCRAARNVK